MNEPTSHIRLIDDPQMIDAIKRIMATELGRYFIFQLLGTFGVNQSPYAVNALQTAFACGMQNAGLQIQDLAARHAPENFALMLKEKLNVRQSVASTRA